MKELGVDDARFAFHQRPESRLLGVARLTPTRLRGGTYEVIPVSLARVSLNISYHNVKLIVRLVRFDTAAPPTGEKHLCINCPRIARKHVQVALVICSPVENPSIDKSIE
jgi:hypothetical protein